MTYQEKYAELHWKFDQAGKRLTTATEKLAFTNGFGDVGDIAEYEQATREFKRAEWAFQNILRYAQSRSLNPNGEFIDQEYMYEVIKLDQQQKGAPWLDDAIRPTIGDGSGVKLYTSTIGLTNDPDVHEFSQATEYKFPVIDLTHGKECYVYLSSMLGQRPTDEEIDGLKFERVDLHQPIYVRVELTIMR